MRQGPPNLGGIKKDKSGKMIRDTFELVEHLMDLNELAAALDSKINIEKPE